MNIWDEIFENEELVKKIVTLQPEEAQKVLAENGYEFSVEEVVEKGNELNEFIKKINSGEITEDALDNVSGGCKWCFAAGVAVGVAAYLLPW